MRRNQHGHGLMWILTVVAVLGLPAWAGAWPVPDSGQATSYAAGDDGSYAINPRSYTDNTDSTVTDNVTKLIWQQQDDGQARIFADANDYCQGLTLGGASDWRLPTVQELASLVDYGKINPATDQSFFPEAKTERYWSSTVLASATPGVWDVRFWDGMIYFHDPAASDLVRCVRSGAATGVPVPLITGSETATDVGTGLLWQRQDDGTKRDWLAALAYCEGLTLDGLGNWRLPTVNELLSLANYDTTSPAIDGTTFGGTKSSWYWTSTIYYPDSPASAWAVSFQYGDLLNYDQTDHYARCVSNGPVNGAEGALTISSPRQADTVSIGATLDILWDSKGQGGQVAIAISRAGGQDGTWEPIVASTGDSGAYAWAASGPESMGCVLKVEPLAAPEKVGYQGLFSIVVGPTTTTSTATASTTTTTTTIPGGTTITLPVNAGWNLLSSTIGFQAAVTFGDSGTFTSVWKWADNGAGGKTWAVYLPGGDGGVAYAQSKGFLVLTAIASGEGFWVNSKLAQQVQISGAPVYGELALSTGWNLVGGKGAQPLAVTGLGAVTSVWKWTTVNTVTTWAVYLPGAADQGAAYAAAKGFGQFTTLQPGEGFWVNVP